MRFAELILTGGRIYTGEPLDPRAEAMAVAAGRIIAIGSEAEVVPMAGPETRTIRLGGRCVVPGFIDSHLHLLWFGLSLDRVDLRNAATLEEALEQIRGAEARTPPGEWIVAVGWDRNLWPRLPTRADLDSIVAHRPVLIRSRDGHAAWVNSLALRRSGVDRAMGNPAGGEVVRDPVDGEPTGLLLEKAVERVFAAMPTPSAAQCDRVISRAAALAVAKGLTGVQTFEGTDALQAVQRLRSRGELPLRVCCHLPKDGLQDALRLGVRTGFGDEWVRLGHLKLFLDGALGSQTAHMLEPYAGGQNRGIATMQPEELTDLVLRATEGGIAPAVHAIGDAANRVALDVFEETRTVWQPAGLRPRIEHAQILHPDDVRRISRLGVIASMQPIHAVSDWPVAERLWGDRNATAYAWRSILDSGAVLAFGSDCPVETVDPLLGIHAAVTRQRLGGQPPGGWNPEQRLRPVEALRAYTLGSAYSTGEEAIKGSLAVGKLADFVVLSMDPFGGGPGEADGPAEAPGEAFLSTVMEATVVGGRVVYGEL